MRLIDADALSFPGIPVDYRISKMIDEAPTIAPTNPLNNFEKWKAELDPDAAQKIIRAATCLNCPAYTTCRYEHAGKVMLCPESFAVWANTECESV